MAEYVKIPKQRIPILIGTDGAVKKEIERRTGSKIDIVPGSTDIEITGKRAQDLMKARDIVTAIGRGFEPGKAMLLLGDDCVFDMLTLKGETENTVKRLMARVIGRRGSVRRKIERSTGARLCIFGKTVSFIGSPEQARRARELVEMILDGRPLQKVFVAMTEQKS